MNILISACLLGIPCRYDGQAKYYRNIEALREKYNLIPFCPEIYGGLPTPRPPAEIIGHKVINEEGVDLTKEYERGALIGLSLMELFNCKVALLKSKSPSCGTEQVYDGTFSGKLIPGEGVFAKLLRQNGYFLFNEKNMQNFQILE